MATIIILSILILIITFLTGSLTYGIGLIPMLVIIAIFANNELKSMVGEGSSDLIAAGFLFPIFSTTNQPFAISVSTFIFLMIWILTIKSFQPNWMPSKQRLFILGILCGVLALLNHFLLMFTLPVILFTLYKSRSSIKHIASLVTGFAWVALGFLFTHHIISIPIPVEFYHPTATLNINDESLRYFMYAISILSFLWAFNVYRLRHRWRPEIRYVIFNIMTFSILGVIATQFDPLSIIAISLPVLHITWNLQVKKSSFSIALALAVIILVWLNQQYVINYLNLQQ